MAGSAPRWTRSAGNSSSNTRPWRSTAIRESDTAGSGRANRSALLRKADRTELLRTPPALTAQPAPLPPQPASPPAAPDAPGHQLHLQHRLVHQQVQAAEHDAAALPPKRRPAASATGGTARRTACPAAAGTAAARSSVAPAGVVPMTSSESNAAAASAQSRIRTAVPDRLGDRVHLGVARAVADVDLDLALRDAGQRRQCRGRRRSRRPAPPPIAASVTPRSAKRVDQAGDVGVRARARPVLGEQHRVHRLHRPRGRADLVQQRDHRALERHGQRQAGPGGVEPGQEAGQRRLVDLVRVIGPVGQAERGVRGPVQDRGQRVGDRGAQDGGVAGQVGCLTVRWSRPCYGPTAGSWCRSSCRWR